MKTLINRFRYRPILIAFQITLAVVIITIIFRKIDVAAIIGSLQNALGPGIVGLMALALLIKYFYALQMHALLSQQGIRITVFDIFKTYLIASFYSFIIPGDIAAGGITWAKLGRKSDAWVHSGMAIAYMRIFNLLLLLTIGLAGSLLDPVFNIGHLRPVIMIGMVLCICSLSPFFSHTAAGWVTIVISKIRPFIPNIARLPTLPDNIIAIIRDYPFHSRNRFLRIFLLGLLIQASNIFYLLLVSNVLSLTLPLPVMLWLWPVLTVFGLFPLAFGGLGVREGLMVLLLAPYAISDAQKVAFSLFLFSLSFITGGLLGAWYEFRDVFFTGKHAPHDAAESPASVEDSK